MKNITLKIILFTIFFINIGVFHFFVHIIPKECDFIIEYKLIVFWIDLVLFSFVCLYIFYFSKDLNPYDSIKYLLIISWWIWMGGLSGYVGCILVETVVKVESFKRMRIDFFLYEILCIFFILFSYLFSKLGSEARVYLSINVIFSFIIFLISYIYFFWRFTIPFLSRFVKFLNPTGPLKILEDSIKFLEIEEFISLDMVVMTFLFYFFIYLVVIFFNFIKKKVSQLSIEKLLVLKEDTSKLLIFIILILALIFLLLS